MEQQTGSKSRKEYVKAVYCHPVYLTYMQNTSCIPSWDFPDSSAGKESSCNAGNPSWIPGFGKAAEEKIGYPLQYSWASLVAQLVKNLPVMRETSVLSLGWEDPLNKGKATHSSILD